MHPRPAAWLSLLLACTPAQPPAPPPTPEPPAPVVVAELPPTIPGPPAATPACSYAAEPPTKLPALIASDPAVACRKPDARARATLHARLRKQWHRSWPKGRLEIRDGCDRLEDPLDSIVFASSNGHGGSLDLGSLERQADGAYVLLLLDYNHYRRDRRDTKDPYLEDSAGTLHIYRSTVDAKTMTPLLTSLRAAAHVEIEEFEPPPTPGRITGSGFGSSHSYHVTLRLTDRAGHGSERHFAGYESSGPTQNDGAPLAIVQTALAELTERVTRDPTAGAIDTSDLASRALFARMFWDAHARENYGNWYLRERMLGLAALLGSAQHMPALLAQLAPTADGKKKDASLARSEVLAINAIAALTGHDLRHDPDGAPRDPTTVAAELLADCARK